MIHFQIIIAIYIFIQLFARLADPRSKILAALTFLAILAVFALTVDMIYVYLCELMYDFSAESDTYFY